ncbi:HlyD family type I secretion periplasmic adaptor subunit [Roseibaca sp. V10]|uniref:Membrane fusion protein (MFP) family protein n=1 Tax=Roseinatronobacter domitianus TaxID=2940293 RepID=A0ABT0LZC2_9RHOB|nr:HlyD family type I secretion periplasmic adaptor subunit [Roseibaca domitiana]MCL1627961.1 HlyD family type I secretion periplasmic adaptor subunit [Roseibaca domitiana]
MSARDPFSPRRHLLLAALTLAVLVFGFGAWAVLSRISSAIIAPGQLEVEQNRQIVQHPEGGVVAQINVVEGARVAAGDVMLRLDGTNLQSELNVVENRLFELLARRARLEAERDDTATITFPAELHAARAERPDLATRIEGLMNGQRSLLAARRETRDGLITQLQQRAAQIDTQVEGITAQIGATDRQITLVGEERATQADLLERGLAQAARVLSLDREAARLEGARGALLSERGSAAERQAEIAQQILSLGAQTREEAQTELRDIAATEVELSERRRALREQVARLDIRAPVSGLVYGLQVTTPRAVLRAAEPALFVVPQDRPLVISARVNPSDIDQVRAGQDAVVMFSGLNLRDLPQLGALVTKVSADAFTNAELAQSYYRIELELQDESRVLLADQTLLPGMPVEVFLQTGDRSPLQYLTEPFLSYFARALREG